MSTKPEAIAQNNQSKWSQDYKDKLAFLKRHSMRLYLQYINPKLGTLIEIFSDPKQFYDTIKPSNVGLWLLISAVLTGSLVLLMPTFFWKLQPIFFLLIFFLGDTVTRFFIRLKDSFKNLLVAYPGKHLLNQEVKLENPIENSVADIILDGKAWQVQGNDCPVGTRVRVIAINESVLFVKVPMIENE